MAKAAAGRSCTVVFLSAVTDSLQPYASAILSSVPWVVKKGVNVAHCVC